jgi:Helix-turn-helix domain
MTSAFRNPAGRARFRWIELALAAADLSVGEKILAVRLGLHLNDDTGLCNPSFEVLAAGTAFSQRHIKRLKNSLVHKGFIDWVPRPGGRGNSNLYFLLNRETVTYGSPLDEATVTPGSERADGSAPKRWPAGHPNNKEHQINPNAQLSSSNLSSEGSIASETHYGKVAPNFRASRDGWRGARAKLKASIAADQDGEGYGGQAVRPVAATRRR